MSQAEIYELIGDIELLPLNDTAYNSQLLGDCAFIEGGIKCEQGLKTAIYISLFTDAEDIEGMTGERRGWWGDSTDKYGALGSRLWTLAREKITANVAARAKKYCEEALEWMITEGIADKVSVVVERSGRSSISIEIEIMRPGKTSEYFKYDFNWEAQRKSG